MHKQFFSMIEKLKYKTFLYDFQTYLNLFIYFHKKEKIYMKDKSLMMSLPSRILKGNIMIKLINKKVSCYKEKT